MTEPLTRRAALAMAAATAVTTATAARAAGNTSAATRAAAAPPLGAIFPLAGPLALVGDECLRGVLLAAAATGQSASLTTIDATNQMNAEDGATKLAAAGTRLLLGTGGSALSYAATAAAELAQAGYVELNASADGITNRGFRQLLRIAPTTTQIAALATRAIAARAKGKPIGLLFNTGATGGAIAAAALAAWKAAKIAPVLSVAYPENPPDLSEQAARLKRAGAGVILHAASPDETPLFFQALADLAWRPSVFGTGGGYALRENAYAVGDAFDGTFHIGPPGYAADGPNAADGPSAAVAAAYEARFGTAPRSAHSLTCYAGALAVFQALAAAKGDADATLAALGHADVAAGTLANGWGISFDKSGQNTRSFVTLQIWKDGAIAAV